MSIHTALFVGEPVKKRETSELKEFVAFTPMIISAMPPPSSAIETTLIINRTVSLLKPEKTAASDAPAARYKVDEYHDEGDDEEHVDKRADRVAGNDAEQP